MKLELLEINLSEWEIKVNPVVNEAIKTIIPIVLLVYLVNWAMLPPTYPLMWYSFSINDVDSFMLYIEDVASYRYQHHNPLLKELMEYREIKVPRSYSNFIKDLITIADGDIEKMKDICQDPRVITTFMKFYRRSKYVRRLVWMFNM